MKIDADTLIKQTFIGKKLISSEFHEDGEPIYDCFDNEVDPSEFTPYGKIIKNVIISTNSSGEDAGILLYFADYSVPFFFYSNDSLMIE